MRLIHKSIYYFDEEGELKTNCLGEVANEMTKINIKLDNFNSQFDDEEKIKINEMFMIEFERRVNDDEEVYFVINKVEKLA